MSKILEGLNEKQTQAVIHTEGPLLIVAGAGTGKTTVITRRLAYLAEQGIAPESILALAFGEKAAGEMEERVDQLLPLGYYNLHISTFHSFCEQALREWGMEIGLPDFRILNEVGQWLMVRNNLEKFELDYYRPLGSPTRFIKALVSHFSRAKDELITPQEYLDYVEKLKLDNDADPTIGNLKVSATKNNVAEDFGPPSELDEIKRLTEVARAYHVYQKLLLNNGVLDFGDLITYTVELLRKRPKILDMFRNRFAHILIDEFQDTNYAQYELIKLLANKKNNIAVVGDDDQSIFKFRGASISNILHFRSDFPEAQFISLTDNYRSGQKILDLAYEFIQKNNPDRLEVRLGIDKKLISHTQLDCQIERLCTEDYLGEAQLVIDKISELRAQDPSLTWNDFAILARSHDALSPFVNQLEAADIPFIYYAHRGLYQKSIIIDLLSYFRLLDNYHESSALYRVLNFPFFGIASRAIIELAAFAKRKTLSLHEALRTAATIKNVDPDSLVGIQRLLQMLDKHTELARTHTTEGVFIQVIGDLKFARRLDMNTRDGQQNAKYLESLGKLIAEFQTESPDKSLKAFLGRIELEMEAGEAGELEVDIEAGPEAVRLLTVHSAKGLEFTHVFLVGLVDKRFPTIERKETIEIPTALVKDILPQGEIHLEEERRLFYVAMTRAKQGLWLTRALDYGGKLEKKASRFLKELGLVDNGITRPTGAVKFTKQTSPFPGAVTLPVPKVFSFSQISTFRKCPLEYKYRYVVGLPMPGDGQRSFGQSIHLTLEKFLRFIQQQQGRMDLFGEVKETGDLPKLEILLQLYEKYWIDEWYESKQQKQEYQAKGKKMLIDFYNYTAAHLSKVKYLEESFKLKLDDAYITGKIDRVDECPGGLMIIDYKTGKPKAKLSPVDKEQLLLYQWAAAAAFKQKVAGLQYWYLADSLETAPTFLGSESEIEKLRISFLETVHEIRAAVAKHDFLERDKQVSHRGGECAYRALEL